MGNYAIVLAAGKGTRMKSRREDVSKVSFPILRKPMIEYVLDSLSCLNLDKIVTVVGFGGERTSGLASPYGEVVWQNEQKGTGHAVMMAAPILEKEEGVTIICCGDTPLLTDKTLSALVSSHLTNHNALTLLTAIVEDPRGHGRVLEVDGRVECIIAQKDCTPDIDAIHLINSGIYVVDNKELFRHLKRINPNNPAKEYHLTDVVSLFVQDGLKVSSFSVADVNETMSVNDRYQLSVAAKIMQRRINKRWMIHGVTMEDPETAYVGPDVKLSRDSTIRPNTYIFGKSYVGHDNVIGPGTFLNNVHIGEGNFITFCHLEDTTVDDNAVLGPYLRTRQGTHIQSCAHIGNFNELKATDFGYNSACLHHSYLGNAHIGDNVNIGAGTIIANYDGINISESVIEDRAFIGSGTTLVSPVQVGKEAFVAAGSVINEDVPDKAMAIARQRQENKEGYAEKLMDKAIKKRLNK